MKTYIVRQDGDSWFASTSDFINLQESEVAFADTPMIALSNFLGLKAIEKERLLGNADNDLKLSDSSAMRGDSKSPSLSPTNPSNDEHLQQLREQILEILMVKQVRPLALKFEDDIPGWALYKSALAHARSETDKILALFTATIEAEVVKQGASEKHQCVCKDCGKQVDKLSEATT